MNICRGRVLATAPSPRRPSVCAGTCRHRPRCSISAAASVGQTLHLVELLPGSRITAIDSHPPGIERLRTAVVTRGLGERVGPMAGDIGRSVVASESFDLIWSEGALYNIGIENAPGICHELLRPDGCLAPVGGRYRRHDPEETVLYGVVREHLETLRDQARDPGGDGYPRFIEQAFRRCMECGLLAHGLGGSRCIFASSSPRWVLKVDWWPRSPTSPQGPR